MCKVVLQRLHSVVSVQPVRRVLCEVVLQRLHSVVGVQPVRRVLCEVVLQRLHLLKNPIVCNCIGPILLILLVIACIVFNCVLPVFNKEYDDDDDDEVSLVYNL